MQITSKIYDLFYTTRKLAGRIVHNLWSYGHIKILFIVQAFVNFLSWLLAIYIRNNVGQPQIALHYSVDFGIDLYDNAAKVLIIPFLGAIFIIINFLILGVIYLYNPRDARFVSYLLLGSGIGANIILITALVSIYFLNFR